MVNQQYTPSELDMNFTDHTPYLGDVADDMDVSASRQRSDRMGGMPVQSDNQTGATEPIAYDEETDILLEAPDETDADYVAAPTGRVGMPQGATPSSTGLEGVGSREPVGGAIDSTTAGFAEAENSPSNSGMEGQGVDEDDGTVLRDV